MAKSEPISVAPSGAQTNHHGELLSTISNRMVQIHKRFYGKGPTKARSYIMGDLVVCLMRGGFTTAEETLIGSGRAEAARALARQAGSPLGAERARREAEVHERAARLHEYALELQRAHAEAHSGEGA